jgi:hypothetical protein
MGECGGTALRKCLQTYNDINFFSCFGVGNSLLKFIQAF